MSLITKLFLLFAVFAAGFIDAIGGGGGLISLPAYAFAGLPMHLAYGTNKFANMFGTLFASHYFAKRKKIVWKAAYAAFPASFIGSWLGAKVVLLMSEKALSLCLLIILPIAALIMFFGASRSKDNVNIMVTGGKLIVYSAIVGFACGAYDGFFGPGTGTFIVLGFTSLVKMDFVNASGTAKILNLASNFGALAVFIRSGDVDVFLGVQCAIASIIGNLIGSKLATEKGSKIIKPIIAGVLIGIMIKLVVGFI